MTVRPGLTGWAQVHGGQKMSATDKAAIDIWYVKNPSTAVDCKIFVKTIGDVIFGERVDRGLVKHVWQDLTNAGICRLSPSNKEMMRAGSAELAPATVQKSSRTAA